MLPHRKQQIWEMLAQGLTNKQIARQLGISPYTVQTHNVSLYLMLGVANRKEAIEKFKEPKDE
jgi:two-component system, NarL family, nitrate/nitrite response regulator NarL